MEMFDAGAVRIGVEFRILTDELVAALGLKATVTGLNDVGVSLHVFVKAEDGDLERLRFDCFEVDPHYHLDPPGANQVTPVPAERDSIDWALEELRTDLPAWLARAGLDVAPAPPADRRTLLRRATYDLTGLPPTEVEVQAFIADDTSGAWERVVDRLLASPHYGEHMARGWLDRQALRELALAHRVCPYYLGQELARWCDVIVGDVNHYFDDTALLHGLAQALLEHESLDGEEIARSSESYVRRADCEHSIDLVKGSSAHRVFYTE